MKRPPNSYMKFGSDVRSKIKEENPGIKVTDVVRNAACGLVIVCVCYFEFVGCRSIYSTCPCAFTHTVYMYDVSYKNNRQKRLVRCGVN